MVTRNSNFIMNSDLFQDLEQSLFCEKFWFSLFFFFHLPREAFQIFFFFSFSLYEPMFLHILGTGYACFTMQNQHGTVVVTILRSRYTVSRCVPYLSYNLPKMQAIQHSICNEFVPLLKRPTWYQFKEADTLSHDVYHTTLLQLFNQYFFVEAFYDATYEGEIFFNSYGKTMLQ